MIEIREGRSLRGNVDRNLQAGTNIKIWGCVVPYVGTWIEIVYPAAWSPCRRWSFPTWERG